MIFILNSAPGVGKSSLMKALRKRLTGFAFIDGDDLGDTAPLESTISWLNVIQDNITCCCVNFTKYGWEHVVAGFVFPSAERVERLKGLLEDAGLTVRIITLVCSAGEITRRIRKRNTSRLISIERAVDLNRMISSIQDDFRLDTTTLHQPETTDIIAGYIESEIGQNKVHHANH